MADWDPALYRRFEDERTRPARELLARVELAAPQRVFDLGCGPGNSTELLVGRWPEAEVIGTDNSEAMLASARERLANVRFELSDISTWQPAAPPQLIYSNATLQWLGGHATLLPRLFALLAPGGVLAVQMPDNLHEPSHAAMREVAALPAFAKPIGDAAAVRSEILSPAGYYDLLASGGADLDIWQTRYQHRLPSPQAIVDWLRGTGLRPFLDRLDPPLRAAFVAEYRARIDAAYPARSDGSRLLAFPRLFIVATRRP